MAAMGGGGRERLGTIRGHEEILKNLLLQNRWSEFLIISEGGGGVSLCGLQRNFSEFFSSETACQILNNLQDCSLGDPFQKLLRNFDPSKNMAAGRGRGGAESVCVCVWGGGVLGFLHCVDFRETLQNSSPLKPQVRF